MREREWSPTETICCLSRAVYFPRQVILPVKVSVQSSGPQAPWFDGRKVPFLAQVQARPVIMQGATTGWGERVRTEEGHFLLQKILSNSKKIT